MVAKQLITHDDNPITLCHPAIRSRAQADRTPGAPCPRHYTFRRFVCGILAGPQRKKNGGGSRGQPQEERCLINKQWWESWEIFTNTRLLVHGKHQQAEIKCIREVKLSTCVQVNYCTCMPSNKASCSFLWPPNLPWSVAISHPKNSY